jgi:hypothetical protein
MSLNSSRRIQLSLAAFLSLVGGACAHKPIPEDAMEAYYSCGTLDIDTAEANLAAEGWPIQSKTNVQITTDWRPISMSGAAYVLTGGARYVVRLLVAKVADSVKFRVFQALGGSTVGMQGNNQREAEWRPITQAQVRDDDARSQLNSFRRAVCGDAEHFTGQEEYLKRRQTKTSQQ